MRVLTALLDERRGGWRPAMIARLADSLLAQSAVDRLLSAAFELIVEGPSYRQRQSQLSAEHANTFDRQPNSLSEQSADAPVSHSWPGS